LVKKGDEIDYYGVILSGEAFASIDDMKIQTLSVGDQIG